MDGTATVIPRRENLNIINVSQLDKDAIVVCYDNVIKILTQQGKLRETKKQVSDFKFDFKIESLGNINMRWLNILQYQMIMFNFLFSLFTW